MSSTFHYEQLIFSVSDYRNDIPYMNVNVKRSMDEMKVFQTVEKLYKYHIP